MYFQPLIEYQQVLEGIGHTHCIFAVAFLNDKLKGNDKNSSVICFLNLQCTFTKKCSYIDCKLPVGDRH